MTHSQVKPACSQCHWHLTCLHLHQPGLDASDEEAAPISDLSHYEQCCLAAYEKDPAFLHEPSMK